VGTSIAGRELPKHSHTSNAVSQHTAATNDLPFRSLHLAEGLKGAASVDKSQVAQYVTG